MKRPFLALLLLGWLVLPVQAANVPFATLDGAQVVPSTGSSAIGQGLFLYDDVTNLLVFNIAVSNLPPAKLSSPINRPAAPGANAGILFDLPNGSFKFGKRTVPDRVEPALLGGLTYVQSTQLPNGKIRGQAAQQVTPVPEPGPFTMLAAGLAAVGAIVFRRRQMPA